MEPKSIYQMELHEVITINSNVRVMRVAGGWLYRDIDNSTFVPYHGEFSPPPVRKVSMKPNHIK